MLEEKFRKGAGIVLNLIEKQTALVVVYILKEKSESRSFFLTIKTYWTYQYATLKKYFLFS